MGYGSAAILIRLALSAGLQMMNYGDISIPFLQTPWRRVEGQGRRLCAHDPVARAGRRSQLKLTADELRLPLRRVEDHELV